MNLLFHPATDLVLTLLITLPLARAIRNLALSHPPGKLIPRLVADSLLRGLVGLMIALALLVALRISGVPYLLVQVSSLLEGLPARMERLPGLVLSAGVEELSRLVCLLVFPLALASWKDEAGNRQARLVAALGMGLVFGMAEALLFAAQGLPLWQTRNPGSLLLHLASAGLLARYILAHRTAGGLFLVWLLHAAYNYFLILEGYAALASLGVLAVLVLLVMREKPELDFRKAERQA